MGSYMVPGPDRYKAVFFKRLWSIVGEAMHHFVRRMIEEREISYEATEATLMLIHKEAKPSIMHGFWPLSLCNVTYKLASKIIVNRLKDVMKELISQCQASIVPGHERLDNAVVCQEFVHSMRYRRAKKRMIVIKVDLEKAYDRLE